VEVQALQEAMLQVVCKSFARTQRLPLEARCSVSSSTWIGGFRGGRLSSLRQGRAAVEVGVDRAAGVDEAFGYCGAHCPAETTAMVDIGTGVVCGGGVGVVSRGGLMRLFLFMGSYVIQVSLYSLFTLRSLAICLIFQYLRLSQWANSGYMRDTPL
jgi:hypothetical protein